jgi:3',5'-cyclic AMP phosphodiesterase CpdA
VKSSAERLQWLHISDLHFKRDEEWDRRATLQALLRSMDGLKLDAVFVTGDIAWSGQRAEYEAAERFFDRLVAVLELPPERWFLVPGNHDIDRSRIAAGSQMSEFFAFTRRFLGDRAWNAYRPWRTDVLRYGGASLAVLQLNSSWDCGSDRDRKRISLGEDQIVAAFEASRDATLRIALLHHPFSDLKDEADAARLLTPENRVAFVLRGHLHRSTAIVEHSPRGRMLYIAAGALYTPPRGYKRAFNIVAADFARHVATLDLYRYSDRGRGFWVADRRTYEALRGGRWRIRI